MKIVGQQPSSVPEAKASRETAAAHKAKAAQTADTGAGQDSVELSPLARALASLRSEVNNGTYDPPASDVADALLRELAANRIG